MPAVSVCIPVYNSADSIDACLASVLAQSSTDFECLVVDNASTDSTIERVNSYSDPRVRIVRNPVNIGPIANHNRCIEEATGDLIQFVHADDRLLPGCLARLEPTFHNPTVGLAFSRRTIESGDPKWAALIGSLHTPLEPLSDVNDGTEIIRKYVAKGSYDNWIGEPTSVMLRRSALLRVGGFSSEQKSFSDMELWLRILARYDAAWVNEELSVRVQHEDTLTAMYNDTDAAWLDRVWILAGMARNADIDAAVRRTVWRQWTSAVVKKAVRAQTAPRGMRLAKYRQLGRHVGLTLSSAAPGYTPLAG